MSYQIFFNEKDGIVHVVFSGTATKEDHYSALTAAIKLCDEKKTSKLLVDFSDLNLSNLSTLDCFSFGESVAGIEKEIHIAHVLSRHSKARENIRFASDVEANRGKMTGEFENIEDATTWLCSIA